VPLGFLPKSYGEVRAGGYRHYALDIHAPIGTEIIAPLDGEVATVSRSERGGNSVEVRCENGLRMRFVHLNSVEVSDGQRIARGQRIGTVGMTGTITPHLHFEVYRLIDGRMIYQNPLELFEKVSPAR
jgi:murein DD-endopeptidase MepM/ murein hydrolase activator NlpD